MFHVGQMVVCIDDAGQEIWGPPPYVKKGEIYTIRGFTDYGGLLVDELHSRPRPDGQEQGYRRYRFRPVKTTSIEIFRQLVANPKDKVRA